LKEWAKARTDRVTVQTVPSAVIDAVA
jgi:hypothetical protein